MNNLDKLFMTNASTEHTHLNAPLAEILQRIFAAAWRQRVFFHAPSRIRAVEAADETSAPEPSPLSGRVSLLPASRRTSERWSPIRRVSQTGFAPGRRPALHSRFMASMRDLEIVAASRYLPASGFANQRRQKAGASSLGCRLRPP
jgi:hypothetical protein